MAQDDLGNVLGVGIFVMAGGDEYADTPIPTYCLAELINDTNDCNVVMPDTDDGALLR